MSICSTLAHAVAVPLPVVIVLQWGYGTAMPFLPGVAVAAAALVYAERRSLIPAHSERPRHPRLDGGADFRGENRRT